jgi:CDP-6-deoxy-D-xylo-4-hexulose-3-dehydrase
MLALSKLTWGEEEVEAAISVIRSGYFTMGEITKKYEEAYAKYVGTKYAVACNSGSSANLLMVAAYTLKHGSGEVIVPAIAWSTSYSPFHQYGWRLIVVDINRHTLNYDIDQLNAAYQSKKSRSKKPLILAVNILGNPNDFDNFPEDAVVLEDNCESMGAEYAGKMTGSFGLMSSHSTFFSHHICTMEGGLVTTDDEEMYHMLLSLRSHGWTRHLPDDNKLAEKTGPFQFILPGYNLRPTEIQSAVGIEQLKKLPGFISVRRENAKRFPIRTQEEIGTSSWYGFAVYGNDIEKVKKCCEYRPIMGGNFVRSQSAEYYNFRKFSMLSDANYVHDHAVFIGNHAESIDWDDVFSDADDM